MGKIGHFLRGKQNAGLGETTFAPIETRDGFG
jgi:hypothetical protein